MCLHFILLGLSNHFLNTAAQLMALAPNYKSLKLTFEEFTYQNKNIPLAYMIICIDCFYTTWALVQIEKSMKPLRPYETCDTLKQFLDHDRDVLGFNCLWDDTESVFGDRRELLLHYYLADDTIEILEVVSPNSGRDTAPKFLRRGKLPKVRHRDGIRYVHQVCRNLWAVGEETRATFAVGGKNEIKHRSHRIMEIAEFSLI